MLLENASRLTFYPITESFYNESVIPSVNLSMRGKFTTFSPVVMYTVMIQEHYHVLSLSVNCAIVPSYKC